ncbi:hypothetical protein QYE76_019649 [Lolium multiflorum]|uniref:Aminotransferase-like plant mobile domain-containing protein n=1 Tax=Lolium multiflorum TaxID=4521 RepID=A0AAD8VNC6_LOLMU|nr:hypothetical protein QYE76_019649 [Lolium multiflorum]
MAESSNVDTMVSGLKVSDILLPHPSLSNSMCLGPRSSESPAHLISCEANRIPFVKALRSDLLGRRLRAWPNPPEGWVSWYNRVSKIHYATWESIGIADALSLSLSPLEKNENILKTIGYFWSDALNCFIFGHGPMTPTLLDVAMITGLDIASPSPSAFKLPKVPFTLSSKKECTSWGAYLDRYMKTKGPVTEREHSFPKLLVGTLHILRAELPDLLTSHRCYTFFDALTLPIPHNLRFSSTTDGFEIWWSMWKTHVFRRALGPQLKQLDAAHEISADQINDTSSGAVEEVLMPSTAPGPSNSPRATDQSSDQQTAKPIVTTSASPPFLGEGCDPSSLLTFDPDSIEPAAPKIGDEPNLGAVVGPLQRLKVLLSSPVDTLVEDPETIRGILVDIQPRLPVALVAKLWPTVTLSVFKSRVQSARQRITLRRAQLPLRADIAEKCQRLNEKKAALDAKTAASTHSARLETLRKELEDLERRARETKQLIEDEESLIARSQEEAQGLTADLKTDLAEIRALSSQLVMGKDEDDEVEIAEVDRIRADALHALNAFLQ